jgi:endoglucanase Acf2
MRTCRPLTVVPTLLLMCALLTTDVVLRAQPPVEDTVVGIRVGAGSYQLSNVGPKESPNVTRNVKAPIPTNDWCSLLFWTPNAKNMYPNPLAVATLPSGLRVCYPPVSANPSAVGGGIASTGGSDLVLGITGTGPVGPFSDIKVDGYSDWFVTAAFTSPLASMKLSFGHGSPFVYGLFDGGNPTVTFVTPPTVWLGDAGASVRDHDRDSALRAVWPDGEHLDGAWHQRAGMPQ